MQIIWFACFIAGGIFVLSFIAKAIWRSKLDAIPTVGSNSLLGSWFDGFHFLDNEIDVLREGYEKYKRRPFKVADRYRWLVVLSSHEHMEELRCANEDELSLKEAVRARTSSDYTTGKEVLVNPYHVQVLLTQLSRYIGVMCSQIKEEVICAFDNDLSLNLDEWENVVALDLVKKVVFRASNRFFVGLPLCRDPEWMDFNLQNAFDVVNGGDFLQRFPLFLEPLISLFIPNITHATKRGMKFLAPMIAERRKYLEMYGEKWTDKPNDILSWLMDVAEGEERTVEHLTRRVMSVNFVSVHITARSFARALIYLAAYPQYIQPLREEVEAAIEQEGWSKAALAKMRKIDSFLKECQRRGATAESLGRKAMMDFTFSDGTFIPNGTLIIAPSMCLHQDEDFYKNATAFDPFRFARMREAQGESAKHQFATTTLEYLPFGHGRHACPGRFLAGSEMKVMLAHIVLSYDVKLEDNTILPEAIRNTSIPIDPNMKVMFRRRT